VTELTEAGIPVTVTCRVLKLSRQTYYRWLANPVTPSEVVEAYRANALFDAHKDDPEFGHRLLADEAAEAGEVMADRTAWRIASANGWFSAFGKPKRGKGRRPGPPVHDDHCAVVDEDGRVRHVFTADEPNELWLTDITEHKTAEGKLYLCAIKDGRFQGASATPSLGGYRDGFVGPAVYRVFDAALGFVGAGDSSAVPREHGSGRGVGQACGHGHSHGLYRWMIPSQLPVGLVRIGGSHARGA
jgi:hypothetical protein